MLDKKTAVKILDISVHQITLPQAVSLIESWLKQKKKRYIVTPNPEMVMLAQKDKQFKRILNQADLAIPDGVGLRLAPRTRGLKRLTGRELMLRLIKRGHKTLLLGGQPGVAQLAAKKLGVSGMSEPDIAAINRLKPDLLFVALGQVKQEKWIAKNLPKLKVKVAMGIGGALDQIAKPWLRAPFRVQALGLEWLWRLIMQPWRIKRQWQLVRFLAKIYL